MGFRNTKTGRSLGSEMRDVVDDFHYIVNVAALEEAEDRLCFELYNKGLTTPQIEDVLQNFSNGLILQRNVPNFCLLVSSAIGTFSQVIQI